MKLMFNEDWLHFIWTRYARGIEVTEQVLRDYIRQYSGTQITDFAINVNGSFSTMPSRVLLSLVDKYLETEEVGIPVNYRETYAKLGYEIFVEKKLDMYQIWIDTLREIGIHPWISVRMNDCHDNGSVPGMRQSRYILEHPELWRIRHRPADEYWDRCLDYGKEEVRSLMLRYIDELLEHYDIDGLELDFTREGYLFAPGQERAGAQVLEDMMTKVRALCDRHERNHRIAVSVLVTGSPSTSLAYGLDAGRWADLGLVDSVVILPRWDTINTDMEIQLWKRLLHGKAALGAGQQLLVKSQPADPDDVTSNLDMAFGQACANLYNGSDFVYLYNYMDVCDPDVFSHSTSIRERESLDRILHNIGDYGTAIRQNRCHVVTYDDYPPYWEEVHHRLPISFTAGMRKYVKISMGEIRENERALVRLGFENELPADAPEVFVNCRPAPCIGRCALDANITDAVGYGFALDTKALSGYAMVEIRASCAAVLRYVDLMITAPARQ